jgi:predicted ATP-grasp superfamily ATP-dependent carboligase
MILISAAGGGGTNRLIDKYKEKFIGITNDKYKLFTSVLDINILVPSAASQNEYIQKVNEVIEQYDITLFIPNSDIEVYAVSKNIEKFKTKVFIPSFDIVDLTFDKWKFHQKLNEKNISSAHTFNITNDDDVKKAFKILNQTPLWCRTRSGSGSKHTSKVIDVDDAISYINHCCNVYNLEKSEFLISEYLGGSDMAVMTIWKDGNIKMCKMAKRVRYNGAAGESAPNVIESFYEKKVETFVIEAINSLNLNPNGILNIDIKCYEDETLAITEINAGRFYYNMQLFNSGRVNALQCFLDTANGKDIGFLYDDPKVIFIRDQDNKPTIISQTTFRLDQR